MQGGAHGVQGGAHGVQGGAHGAESDGQPGALGADLFQCTLPTAPQSRSNVFPDKITFSQVFY